MSPPGQARPVAVIDIGSNSIKILVATRTPAGSMSVLMSRSIDARISTGISQTPPRLSDQGMAAGLEAIQALLAEANPFSPRPTVLVATSAVRDARNGDEFRERIHAATGLTILVLTGEEESNLIGRGLTCDPTLAGLRDFYVFDLGGGSLECLRFRNRRVEQAASLQLGCVRLTEKFAAPASDSLSADAEAAIQAHTRECFAHAAFTFGLPPDAIAIGTGGTMATVRAIHAARSGRPFEASDPRITVAQLRELLACLGALSLAERQQVPGLPPARADVFPTALATIIAVAEIGHLAAFRHSLYNLRYGVADELLWNSP